MLFQAVPGASTQQQHLTAQPSSEKASASSQQEQMHSGPCETGSGIHPDCLEHHRLTHPEHLLGHSPALVFNRLLAKLP